MLCATRLKIFELEWMPPMRLMWMLFLIVVSFQVSAAQDASRTFVIQPGADGQDAFVLHDTGDPTAKNRNYGDEPNLRVGRHRWHQLRARTFLRFSLATLPDDVWPEEILEARLWLYRHTDGGQARGRTIGVYRVVQPWDEHTLTWTNQPKFDPVPVDFVHSTGIPGWRKSEPRWFSWDVTRLVREWVAGVENYGIMVKTATGEEMDYFDVYYSSDYTDAKLRPKLEVKYVRRKIRAWTEDISNPRFIAPDEETVVKVYAEVRGRGTPKISFRRYDTRGKLVRSEKAMEMSKVRGRRNIWCTEVRTAPEHRLEYTVEAFGERVNSSFKLPRLWRESTRFRDKISLNGRWKFLPVKADRGKPPGEGWGTIKVPNCLGVQFDVLDADGRVVHCWNGLPINGGKDDYKRWWFEREFEVPKGWEGRQIVLHVQAVAYMRVFVNGKLVGEHYGALTEYQPDITRFVRLGEPNTLSIFVANSFAAGKYTPTGKFHGRAGIWGDVYIEARPFVHIDNVYILTSVRQRAVEVRVRIRNDGETPVTVSVANAVYEDVERRMEWKNIFSEEVRNMEPSQKKRLWKRLNELLWQDKERWGLGGRLLPPSSKGPCVKRLDSDKVVIAPGKEHTFVLSKSWRKPKLWSPEHPHLYWLHTALVVDGNMVDEKWTRFGFREVRAENGKIYLNGKVIHLRGESAPTPVWGARGGLCAPTTRVLLQAIKDASLNAVRFHGGNPSEIGLDIADEIGLLFIDESGVCFERPTDEAGWQVVESEFKAWIERDRNHPSVIIWSASNEIRHRPSCRRLSSIIRRHDATRLVENEWIGGGIGLSQIEGDHIDCAHYPRKAEWGHHATRKTSKPILVGECFFMQRDTKAIERMVKAWRTYGVNIMLFTPSQELSLKKFDFLARALKYGNLSTPQPKPDRIVHCGIGDCWNVIDPKMPPYEPNETGMLRTIMKVCGPILVYIGGPPERVWEEKNDYTAGEKVEKTIVIINDTESKVRFNWRWQAGNYAQRTGSVDVEAGGIVKLPIVFKAPQVDKRTDVTISAEVKALEKVWRDSLTITVAP